LSPFVPATRNATSTFQRLGDVNGVPRFSVSPMSRSLNTSARSALTWNGALSYPTTGAEKFAACLDYWTKAGTYTGREPAAVAADMERIFADDEKAALAVVFGLRLITRRPEVEGIDDVQTGYGRRDEFYEAVSWLHDRRRALLEANLALLPVFGCWKDLVSEPLIDVLDRERVYALVGDNLGDPLLRKYLPQVRSAGQVRTERDRKRVSWAKGLCRFLGIGYPDYRRLKSEGAAHVWQRQMGRGQWGDIHFNGIPGKAMLRHVSQKGRDGQTVFERHGQVERLKEWVLQQPEVKFTGYPYELTRAAGARKKPTLVQKLIYDRQFRTMLGPFQGHKLGNVLCALDTSGSMTMEVVPGVSAYDICLSMGLVFSSLNVGWFRDVVVAFNDVSSIVRLSGEFTERLHQLETMTTAWGSTNFQSVIDLLIAIRRGNPNVPLREFPETLLVVSDMQFNPVGGNARTNYEEAMRRLREVGLPELRIIWWFVNGAGGDFPARMDDKGVYLIGGFDPVNLRALLGLSAATAEFSAGQKKEQTPLDGMMNFLGQPIFGLLRFPAGA
jgi:hypothetical protein